MQKKNTLLYGKHVRVGEQERLKKTFQVLQLQLCQSSVNSKWNATLPCLYPGDRRQNSIIWHLWIVTTFYIRFSTIFLVKIKGMLCFSFTIKLFVITVKMLSCTDYLRMSRYVAKLFRKLTKPSFDYMKQKTRDEHLVEKYIILPAAHSNFFYHYFEHTMIMFCFFQLCNLQLTILFWSVDPLECWYWQFN